MRSCIFFLTLFFIGAIVLSSSTNGFFNDISESKGNSISLAKTFSVLSVATSDHILIHEVLYDATEAQDIYKQLRKNRAQWVELYNPTNSSVDLSGWTLEDNAGSQNAIKLSGTLAPGRFLLIINITPSQFKKVWNVSSSALLIETNFGKIGDGLDPLGDMLILKDKNGTVIDQMSWGKITSGFNAGCVKVCSSAPTGASLERAPVGNDTNSALNFIARRNPTPGRGL